MALVLEGNYSKKIGLAGYSSHQFSLTLKTEITDITQVQAESTRLYQLLQQGVDQSIQQVGYLPEGSNGNGNGHTQQRNGNGHAEAWNCTNKQRDLILKIVDENRLDKAEVEKLAQDRYGKGVKALNKLEASALIEELFERHPRKAAARSTQPAR